MSLHKAKIQQLLDSFGEAEREGFEPFSKFVGNQYCEEA